MCEDNSFNCIKTVHKDEPPKVLICCSYYILHATIAAAQCIYTSEFLLAQRVYDRGMLMWQSTYYVQFQPPPAALQQAATYRLGAPVARLPLVRSAWVSRGWAMAKSCCPGTRSRASKFSEVLLWWRRKVSGWTGPVCACRRFPISLSLTRLWTMWSPRSSAER